MRGFSLIEILIALILLGILLAISIPVGLNLLYMSQLDSAADNVLGHLRFVQSRAMTQEWDASHGIYVTSTSYTSFAGDSYMMRNTAFDQTFDFSGWVTATTTFSSRDVVFSRLTGLPEEEGSLTLSNPHGSRTIRVNSQGRISSD